jgi:hypothetical protein
MGWDMDPGREKEMLDFVETETGTKMVLDYHEPCKVKCWVGRT